MKVSTGTTRVRQDKNLTLSFGVFLLAFVLTLAPGFEHRAAAQEDVSSQLNSRGSNGGSGGSSSRRALGRSRSSGLDQSNDQPGANGDTGIGSSRRRRSEAQRDRENNSKPAKGTPAAGQTPASGGKALTNVKNKQPTAKAESSGSARATTNVEFKMKANPDTNLIFIEGMGAEPTMNIQALEGKEFVTRVGIQNPRGSTFDTFMTSLKYDPSVIRPVGIDDSDVASLVKEQTRAEVDARRGVITFSGDLATSRTDPMFTLFKVQWKAMAPTSDSAISFLNSTAHPTFVKSPKGDNILHHRDDDGQVEASEKAGLVDASVSVAPSEETARVLTEEEGSFSSIALAHNINQGTAEGGVQLQLRPRKEYISVGEEFLVDVAYTNPKRAEIDTIKLMLKFDPRVLQVVDYDEENWVTRGVNIYDGAYREDLPFDFHRKNAVSNERGLIEYDMGFATRVRIPGSGVIATIKMVAVAPIQRTSIQFLHHEAAETDEEKPTTAVTFLGFNLIGTPGARPAALRNAQVTIGAM